MRTLDLAETAPTKPSPKSPPTEAERADYARRMGLVRGMMLDMVALSERAAGRVPFYVQVGAHDGKKADPIYPRVINDGWHGLLIEPSGVYTDKLRALHAGREGIAIRQLAISDAPGHLHLYRLDEKSEHLFPDYASGCATLDRDQMVEVLERTRPDGGDFVVSETVETQRLDDLLAQEGIERAGALVIDVEGHEPAVFRGLDLNRFQTPLILFEHVHLDRATHRAQIAHLADAGFSCFRVRQDTMALGPAFLTSGVLNVLKDLGAVMMRS